MITENDVKNGAIIICCYGEDSAVQAVQQRVLALDNWQKQETHWWQLESKRAACQLVKLPEATLFQVAINASTEDVGKGWALEIQQLEMWFPVDVFGEKAVWGWSLIYQADCEERLLRKVAAIDETLLALARPLHQSGRKQWLAHGVIPSGHGWLLQSAENDKQTITLFLSKKGNDALSDWIMRPSQQFLRGDAIAHRGYVEHRAYQQLKPTLHIPITVLQNGLQPLLRGQTDDQLATVGRQYEQALGLLPQLDYVRQGLEIPQRNLVMLGKNSAEWLWSHHRQRLAVSQAEADYSAETLRSIMDSASTAIALVQARLDEQQAKREGKRDLWLALVGLSFAIPAIFDREILAVILGYLGYDKTNHTELPLLLAQIILIVAVYLFIRWWAHTFSNK